VALKRVNEYNDFQVMTLKTTKASRAQFLKRILILALIALLMLPLLTACEGEDEDEGGAGIKTTPYSSKEGALSANLKNSRKIVLCDPVIELTRERDLTLFEEKDYVVRDTILATLRSLTEEDMKREDIQSVLSDTLCEKLNEAFGIKSVHRVFFNKLIAAD